VTSAAILGGTAAYVIWRPRADPAKQPVSVSFLFDEKGVLRPPSFPSIKRRVDQIASLKGFTGQASTAGSASNSPFNSEPFDILVIGAGATGSGIALDAVTRGLKVALVDRNDFAGATSSKSTKLVHGGVRYLESAVWKLDYKQ
jgi:glycerol-3-phosphate dehydrogenase